MQLRGHFLIYFRTEKGEKFFNPSFGSGIPDLLFEPFDFVTGAIKTEVENLINLYEPRVSLIEVAIDLDESNNAYEVQIVYLIPDSGQVNNVTLSLTSSSRI